MHTINELVTKHPPIQHLINKCNRKVQHPMIHWEKVIKPKLEKLCTKMAIDFSGKLVITNYLIDVMTSDY